MFELGSAAEAKHYELGKILVNTGVDYFVGVGKLINYTAEGAQDAGLPPRGYFFPANIKKL